MSKFFIAASGEGAVAQILIYDVIYDSYWEEDITSKNIIAALATIPDEDVKVRINCLGGDHKEGVAIYNALANHKGKVEVVIEGYACSMATVVACAGDVVKMCETALAMTHKASTSEWGNADDLRAMADYLDLADQSMAKAYARKTGKTEAEALAILDNTHDKWHSAEHMLALGVVDEVIVPDKFTALMDRDGITALAEGEGAALIKKDLVPKAVLQDLQGVPGVMGYRVTPEQVQALKTQAEASAGDEPDPVDPPADDPPADEPDQVDPPADDPPADDPPADDPPPANEPDPIQAERDRVQAIRAMAKKNGLQPDDDLIDSMINDGTSVALAGPMVLAVAKSISDHNPIQHNHPSSQHQAPQGADNHGWGEAYKR